MRRLAKVAALVAGFFVAGCSAATGEKEANLAAFFSDVCVAANSSGDAVEEMAVSRQWTAHESPSAIEGAQGRRAWDANTVVIEDVRIAVWIGNVDDRPHELCMVIASANANVVAQHIRTAFGLPGTEIHLEDEGRQQVRYWFFERGGRTNYLEVRQAIAGGVAGSASIALGVPLS